MTGIITIEEFERQEDKILVQKTGKLLQKFYPGYAWMVRSVAKQMVQICLGELFQYGGDRHGMVINPKSWKEVHEFEGLVRKMGGELLERASLSRKRSQGLQVTKRPDGFHARLDQTTRTKKIILKS